MNEVSVVPPATLAEGQTQAHHFTISACSTVTRITTEWVAVKDSSRPFMLDATNRSTVVPETAIQLNPQPDTIAPGGQVVHHYDGRDSWTIPTGQPNGHYAVITRYYADADPSSAEAQAASSFSIATPDMCANLTGSQQSVPAGYQQQGADCEIPPNVVTDYCPNVGGVQDPAPAGYQIVDGQCKLVATPTGSTPTPLAPTPRIVKTASVKHTVTGGRVKYTIRVANTGKGTLRGSVTCDKLPSGTTFVAASKGFGFTNGSVCWKTGNLTPGAHKTVTLTVKVSASFHGKVLTNTACMTSTNAKKVCSTAKVTVTVHRPEPIGGVTG